jgi:TonB family protein
MLPAFIVPPLSKQARIRPGYLAKRGVIFRPELSLEDDSPRIRSLVLFASLILLQACGTRVGNNSGHTDADGAKPQYVMRGSDADYYFSDWRRAGVQKGYDVMPMPVGGMNALISRLTYPTELRRQRIGAEVRLLISFDASGRVVNIRVIQSGHQLLSRIATNAILATRWTPAQKNGHPAAVKAILPLTFLPP